MRVRMAEEDRQSKLEEEEAEAAEERRRMVDAQDTRPRTYDVDGRIIWIQEPDPDSLPHVQAIPDIDIESKENDFLKSVQNYTQLPQKKPPPPPKEDVDEADEKSPKNRKKAKS